MDLGLTHLQDGIYHITNAYQAGAMFTSSVCSTYGVHSIGLSSADKDFQGHGDPLISEGKWRWEVERQSDGSYKIASAQVGGALFLSKNQLYGRADHEVGLSPVDKEFDDGNTGKWRWRITRQENGTFKISNEQRGGALFCIKYPYGLQPCDFIVGWSADDKEEGSGKWRWHFRLVDRQSITCSMRVSAEGMALVTCTALCGEELGTIEVEQVAKISSLVRSLSEDLRVPACEIVLLDQEGKARLRPKREFQRMDLGLTHLQDGTYYISTAYQAGSMFTSCVASIHGEHAIGLSSDYKEFHGHGDPLISAGKWRWEVERQSDGSYKIASAQVGGALFLSSSQVNEVGLFSVDNEFYDGNIFKWRWDITEQENGTFTISNKQRGGALFCSKFQFGEQPFDFVVGWSPDDKEDGTGKWRWHLRLASRQLITCSMRVSAEGMAFVTCTRSVCGEGLGTIEVEQVAKISSLVRSLSEDLRVPACEIVLLDQEGNLLPHTATVVEVLSGGE